MFEGTRKEISHVGSLAQCDGALVKAVATGAQVSFLG